MLSSTAKLVDATIFILRLPIEPISGLPIAPIGSLPLGPVAAVPRTPLGPLGCFQFRICPVHSPAEALGSLLYCPTAPTKAEARFCLGKEGGNIGGTELLDISRSYVVSAWHACRRSVQCCTVATCSVWSVQQNQVRHNVKSCI